MLEKVHDLRLDRYVEGGDRLVADDKLRVKDERASDPDSLPLAARKAVRVAARIFRSEADGGQHGANGVATIGAASDSMDREGLGQDLADRHARIEGGIGVLENDLHASAQRRELGARRGEHLV